MTPDELDTFRANWHTAWKRSGPHVTDLGEPQEPSDPEPMSAAEEAALDNWFEHQMERNWP